MRVVGLGEGMSGSAPAGGSGSLLISIILMSGEESGGLGVGGPEEEDGSTSEDVCRNELQTDLQ